MPVVYGAGRSEHEAAMEADDGTGDLIMRRWRPHYRKVPRSMRTRRTHGLDVHECVVRGGVCHGQAGCCGDGSIAAEEEGLGCEDGRVAGAVGHVQHRRIAKGVVVGVGGLFSCGGQRRIGQREAQRRDAVVARRRAIHVVQLDGAASVATPTRAIIEERASDGRPSLHHTVGWHSPCEGWGECAE